jgi:hypothetical protein
MKTYIVIGNFSITEELTQYLVDADSKESAEKLVLDKYPAFVVWGVSESNFSFVTDKNKESGIY